MLMAGLAACTGSTGTLSPSQSSVGPSTGANTVAASPSLTEIDQVLSLTGNRRLKLRCTGSQGPTVLLESDDETDSGQWNYLVQELDQTRVCSYDRAGLGESSRARGCRDAADLRNDLLDLLAAAKLEPPYVLVGAGGGGVLAVNFALAHPDQVAGLVLAETPRAIRPAEWPAEVLVELACTHPANLEHRDYVGIEKQVWGERRSLGDLPMTVISNNYGAKASNAEERSNVRDQRLAGAQPELAAGDRHLRTQRAGARNRCAGRRDSAGRRSGPLPLIRFRPLAARRGPPEPAFPASPAAPNRTV